MLLSLTVPERGPDFWRILEDDPYRNRTNVTLLFEVHKLKLKHFQTYIQDKAFKNVAPPQHLQISGESYCVDGFIVQHQASSGSVMREQIELASSYSFEWDQMPQTVTVEAYNSLGSSTNNVNLRLERQPKRK